MTRKKIVSSNLHTAQMNKKKRKELKKRKMKWKDD